MDRDRDVCALEFYSGIGGLHKALKQSKVHGTVLRAFDWDQNTIKVYNANHGADVATKADISELSASYLSSFRANLWILSPACQPYTVLNPDAKGALDPRAKSFLHLIQDVLPVLAFSNAHPTHLLVENVGGFEGSTTHQILLSQLHILGYSTAEFLLTPLQFGIPNSRLRYYLLAKLAPFAFPPSVESGSPYRYIPQENDDHSSWIDPRIDPDAALHADTLEIRDYLDDEGADDSSLPHRHAVPEKVLEKWGRLFDIVLPSAKRTCCFTRGYTQLVERTGSILQMNEELDTTETFGKFLAAQSNGVPDAVSILHPLRLRYFSPSELLRLFKFNPLPDRESTKIESPPADMHSESNPNSFGSSQIGDIRHKFIWPEGISQKTKYRLIGNSVNVHVVTELINFLYEDWEEGTGRNQCNDVYMDI